MFLYERKENFIRILGCLTCDGVIKVPEQVEGLPVTELAPYVFSSGTGKDEVMEKLAGNILWCEDDGTALSHGQAEQQECYWKGKGVPVSQADLPDSIIRVGRYGFYNCSSLSRLSFSSRIKDLEAGVFTGCSHLSYLKVRVDEQRRSCLQEVLSELRHQLTVEYICSRGKALLLFPEMFEESVENTPARIIMREMHGCGHMYRYCFDQSQFQFHRYDSLFPHIKVQEPERTVVQLAMGRLRYPLGLQPQYESVYETYLREHIEETVKEVMAGRNMEQISWLAVRLGDTRENLDRMIEEGNKAGLMEAVSLLMDQRHRQFGVKKKRFSLEDF
ncbi:MAG TPA: leucine-rich repeat protein [Candidatus Hungatella pullicola]|nr:leucine-rich repeat protein [Candidatus Hungatella pullicola]